MGAEDIALPARLVKTAQGDEVRLHDGQAIKLPSPLKLPDGQELVIAIATKTRYHSQKQELAKQLLQEIINS